MPVAGRFTEGRACACRLRAVLVGAGSGGLVAGGGGSPAGGVVCGALAVAFEGAQAVRRPGLAKRLLAGQVAESGDELKVEELAAGGEWRAIGRGIARRGHHSSR